MGRRNARSHSVLKTETALSSTAAENVHLKKKNSELAKALEETEMLYKHLRDETDYIRKELFGATLRIKKLEKYMNNIDGSVRETLNCIFALSGHATEILNFVNCSRRISSIGTSLNLNQTSNKSQSPLNKTQAVKPMIDGHVIYSPTINLRRVNAHSFSEIQSRRSTNNLQNVESDYDDPGQDNDNLSANNSFERLPSTNRQYRHVSERQTLDEVNDDLESNDDNSEESAHSEDIQLSINDIRRLSTIEEEEMGNNMALSNSRNSLSNNGRSHNLPGAAGQIPLLSGVFRDVRVYLSPVDPLPHITKVRGSSKSHKFKSSDVQVNRSHEAGPSSTENMSMNDEVQEESVEANNSNFINKFPKGTCSSTPITSFVSNQSTSTLNVGNSSVENHSTNTRTKKRRRTTDHTNPKKLVFNKASQSDNHNRSCVTDDDPLEGPSSLLDSAHASKLHTLSQLGLSPISAVNVASSPTVIVSPESRESSEGNASTTKKHVTKRKLRKKKSVVVSSKRMGVVRFTKSPQEISFRAKRMATSQISPKSENSAPNLSAQSISDKSPNKKMRPKRAASKQNFKEPPLNKKLRRSK